MSNYALPPALQALREKEEQLSPLFFTRIEETPGYQLFHTLFLCRTNYIQSLPDYEVRYIGVPCTYDDDLNKQLLNEMVTRYLPISKMLELFAKGVNIAIVNTKDTKHIYDIIVAHLEAWKVFASRSLNITDIPIDDFKIMAEFAGKVYKYAQRHYLTELSTSALQRTMDESGTVRDINTIFKKDVGLYPDFNKSKYAKDIDYSKLNQDMGNMQEDEPEPDSVDGPHSNIITQFQNNKRFKWR